MPFVVRVLAHSHDHHHLIHNHFLSVSTGWQAFHYSVRSAGRSGSLLVDTLNVISYVNKVVQQRLTFGAEQLNCRSRNVEMLEKLMEHFETLMIS